MVAPVNLYANSSSWMGMAIETTYGTPAATPAFWIPVKSPKIAAMITEVDDDGLRGSMVKVYNQIPTVRHDTYDFTCLLYYDTVPALFRSLLGSSDTITGTGPYSHVLSLLNNSPATANQPPSYTFFDYDGYQVRQLPGAQVDDITVKFTATGLVELTVKVLAFPMVNLGTVPTTAFSTVQAQPAWDCAVSLNSVVSTAVVDGELSFKRGSKPVHVLGQQGPYKIQVGPLETGGKLTVLNSNDTELGFYINNTSFPASMVFTPPASTANTWTLDLSTCKSKNAAQERGSDELIVTSFDLVPLPNSNDATAGGVSPVKSTHVTAQATTY